MAQTRQKSMWLSVLVLIFAASCGTTNKTSESMPDKPLVEEKYRLTDDRSSLEKFRQEVPPEKKIENDEMALFMKLLDEVKLKPSDVRNKFDRIARKKRDQFNKDMQKKREQYVKEEKKKRESFLKSLESDRKNFVDKKPPREERADFFRDLDTRRADYFAEERDLRNQFESDIRDQRKNFEDYMREKTDTFNQEYRSYVKRYDEQKKENKDAQGNDSKGMKPFLEEFMEAEKVPGTRLESGQ